GALNLDVTLLAIFKNQFYIDSQHADEKANENIEAKTLNIETHHSTLSHTLKKMVSWRFENCAPGGSAEVLRETSKSAQFKRPVQQPVGVPSPMPFVVLGSPGTSLHSTKEGRWLGGSLTRPPRDLTRVHYRKMAPLAHEANLTIYSSRTKCFTAEMIVKTEVSDPRKSFSKVSRTFNQ
ncbi:hypothetical protein KUF71_006506, partial [Frankliniella fusca]